VTPNGQWCAVGAEPPCCHCHLIQLVQIKVPLLLLQIRWLRLLIRAAVNGDPPTVLAAAWHWKVLDCRHDATKGGRGCQHARRVAAPWTCCNVNELLTYSLTSTSGACALCLLYLSQQQHC
jgi:hypothetical protein